MRIVKNLMALILNHITRKGEKSNFKISSPYRSNLSLNLKINGILYNEKGNKLIVYDKHLLDKVVTCATPEQVTVSQGNFPQLICSCMNQNRYDTSRLFISKNKFLEAGYAISKQSMQ